MHFRGGGGGGGSGKPGCPVCWWSWPRPRGWNWGPSEPHGDHLRTSQQKQLTSLGRLWLFHSANNGPGKGSYMRSQLEEGI